MPDTPRLLVLYHANCLDGFTAAWCAHRRFGDRADYLPVQYGEPPPDVAGRVVYVLDFSYKRPVLDGMAASACGVAVIDHHKTAEEELRPYVEAGLRIWTDDAGQAHQLDCRFDLSKSGAMLAWEYFFPGEQAPWLVRYAQDRDLWEWQLPYSREVSAALASLPWNFETWDGLLRNWLSPEIGAEHTLVREGAAILRYQRQQVEAACKNAVEIDLDGHRVLCTNATLLISEIAGKLAEGRPFGATWFERGDGKRVWSLRSAPDGVDVSEIAKRRGGGGHVHAAGFTE